MAKELKPTVQYYYDSHPTEEDLMGETWRHVNLIDYLKAVLQRLFRGQACAIHENLNFYQTLNEMERPVAPDIAVIKGVDLQDVNSWTVGQTGPAPHVVIEVLSKETWRKDLEEKPEMYGLMGVAEYFVYDPNEPPIRRGKVPRLLGWRREAGQGQMVAIGADQEGRLWSEQLESWLVPGGAYLRLYDREQQLRLTQVEAEAEARRAETKRAEAEKKRAETEKRRAEVAAQKAQAEARRVQALAEKLRSLGVNPDEV